jgi:hypothetical protein
VAIYRLLQQSALSQDDIDRMVRAYEACLAALAVKSRSDPLSEKVARLVIEIAQTGERDPAEIERRVLNACRSR